MCVCVVGGGVMEKMCEDVREGRHVDRLIMEGGGEGSYRLMEI